ncbi:MAG: molybdopterin-dependent oxidoreductase, partial [Microthrixaceae bacterium]
GRGGSGISALVSILLGGAVTLGVLVWLGRLACDGWPQAAGDPAEQRPVMRTAERSSTAVRNRAGRSGAAEGTGSAGRSGAAEGSGSVGDGGGGRSSQEPSVGPEHQASRRRFFTITAALGGAAALGTGIATWLRSNAAVATERMGLRLPNALNPLPPVPAGVSVDLDGVAPFMTPNADFYRIDTAFVVPKVSIEDWTLRVHGLVQREVSLDFASLLERPMIELDATIACVSNEVGGGLVGTARWLGCRLDDLLGEAGIDPSADQVVGRSIDGFTAGFPTAALDGRDAMVAVGMNGEPLPTDHGYPARLIVPGLYGYVSATKWLTEIELTRFDAFEGYWIPRGWDRDAPVQTSSRIDTPRGGAEVAAGEPVGIGGVAWAMNRGIDRVEVQVDDGAWQEAMLGEQLSGTTWRQWRHSVSLDPGEHRIAVRASDTDGVTQSGTRLPPGPNASSGWHTISVVART